MFTYVPTVVYALRLFYNNYIVHQIFYVLVSLLVLVSIISPCFVALHLPFSEIANMLPEAVYCCTLFTAMFIFSVIFVMCSLKSMMCSKFRLLLC